MEYDPSLPSSLPEEYSASPPQKSFSLSQRIGQSFRLAQGLLRDRFQQKLRGISDKVPPSAPGVRYTQSPTSSTIPPIFAIEDEWVRIIQKRRGTHQMLVARLLNCLPSHPEIRFNIDLEKPEILALYDGRQGSILLSPRTTWRLERFSRGAADEEALYGWETLIHEILHSASPRFPTGLAYPQGLRDLQMEEGLAQFYTEYFANRVLDRAGEGEWVRRHWVHSKRPYESFVDYFRMMEAFDGGSQKRVHAVWTEPYPKKREDYLCRFVQEVVSSAPQLGIYVPPAVSSLAAGADFWELLDPDGQESKPWYGHRYPWVGQVLSQGRRRFHKSLDSTTAADSPVLYRRR